MTDPTEPDDGWASLARELGLEGSSNSPTTPPPLPRSDEPAAHSDVIEESPAEYEPAEGFTAETEEVLVESSEYEEVGDDDGEPEGEAEVEGEEGEAAEGDGEGDGTAGEPGQKKRRRRRRRRKKKGPDGTAGEAAGEGEAGDEESAEEFEPAEEPAPDATRDLIANWNVPSWEEIVAGLYRPDR